MRCSCLEREAGKWSGFAICNILIFAAWDWREGEVDGVRDSGGESMWWRGGMCVGSTQIRGMLA